MCFVHTCAHPMMSLQHKTMPPTGRAHTHLYPVQVWSKWDWQFPRYQHFCILPPTMTFLIWPLSDHPAPETWHQNQLHNNWSPCLPRPLPDTIASALTARTASISLPIYDWDSQDAYQLLLHILPYPGELAPPQLHPTRQQGPPQICFCNPGNKIPGDACTMDAYRQQRGTESDQGKSFCLPWLNPTGNDTWSSTPMCILENSKRL